MQHLANHHVKAHMPPLPKADAKVELMGNTAKYTGNFFPRKMKKNNQTTEKQQGRRKKKRKGGKVGSGRDTL
ncbi:hypothetical protein C4H11_13770 [Bacteroides zoogleoformans]|uniref:Uncharacterized protein n=1 Tax=Bacteroides zoogleoformans TaxID=28119 RepID=A0ABM6TAD6_9BACE|nr:hypothetical protein C4H11_03425 [Bacteroides zoogleoformans]AVM53463.1 hypothetical protein C4H11_11430 [Bacteroides zoogleoformans]AVM53832.1 hypothetical protein C4H11_13770 [Bacteroides zoogleoformans]